MSPPYRDNVIPLIPLPNEPKELFSFQPWDAEKRLATSEELRKRQEGHNPKADVYCPKCSFNTLYVIPALCTGKKIGLCKKVECGEVREHFHVRCDRCGWRTLMGTREMKKDT
jgi:DNA-directed RNA polymerase subunit RPC12/RpoP